MIRRYADAKSEGRGGEGEGSRLEKQLVLGLLCVVQSPQDLCVVDAGVAQTLTVAKKGSRSGE